MAKIISSNVSNKEELFNPDVWINRKLNEEEIFQLKNRLNNGGAIVFNGYGVENYNLLTDRSEDKIDFYRDKIEYGLVIPLSFGKNIFNSLKIYPLYLKEGEKQTESFFIKDFSTAKFDILATSYNGRSSYPTITLHKKGKGVIVLVGIIFEEESYNMWNSYLKLFKNNLSLFLYKRGFKKRDNIWKYFYSKFDNISFLLKENKELECVKRVLIKEKKKTEKFLCKNRKIYFENIGMLGKIVSPPVESVYDLGFEIEGGWIISHYSKIVRYSAKEKKVELFLIPDNVNPTIFLYLHSEEETEININYKIHFKMLPPFPEYFYSKLNYSISENKRMFIVHSYDNHLFFINRFSFIPSKIKVVPKDDKTPFLDITLSVPLKQNNNCLIQFSVLYKEDKIKKSELRKILTHLKKRTVDEAQKSLDSKSLKLVRKKGEKIINYKKLVSTLLEKFYYTDNNTLTLINNKKPMEQEEISESLINLAILGYYKEVGEILNKHKELKRFPYVTYPSGATIFDYSEKAIRIINKIDLYVDELKGSNFEDKMIPAFLRKKISLFFEFNFRGLNFWNEQISNLRTLYFIVLNPLISKDTIVFAPIIPYFINNFTVKNINIGTGNFNFQFKRKGKDITVKFKNNNNFPINIEYYPVFMRKIDKIEVKLINSYEIKFKLDRDYLLYSKDYDFVEKPEFLKQDDKVKIVFNKKTEENRLIYISLELYGLNVKKIVGARINKGVTKEEKILLYNPALNKKIYIYFKEIPEEKHLFEFKK